MSVQPSIEAATPGSPSTLLRDAAMATVLALLVLLPYLANGELTGWPYNNDSMLRLVQVRDLIAGQGWYDYMQYRMGPEGGFMMHWSRIVDLPVALIITAVSALTGSATTGEMASGIIWPSLLLAAALLAIVRSARILGGSDVVLPAAVIGTTSLYSIGIFSPGSFDHHNLQLALCLLALWAMLGGSNARHGFGAGAAMAVTMAIGLETLPFVAALCAVAALTYLIEGQSRAAQTAGFGFGFGTVAALSFLATIGPAQWPAVHCDAFSVAHLSVAAIGGFGLAAATHPLAASSLNSRATALGGLGLAVVALVLSAYPECLADPYAGLDERLQTFWLSGISEAQPVTSIWERKPLLFAKFYATPIAALAVLAACLLQTAGRRVLLIMSMVLLVAVLVSFWQIRGSNFAVALATIPLAMWVGHKRRAAADHGGGGAVLAMVLAWIVSLNVCWMVGAGLLHQAASPAVAADVKETGKSDETAQCYNAEANAVLAALPKSTVAAVSNLGPAILKYTQHHVLAGPYHRNIAGNIENLDIFMKEPDDSRRVLAENKVDFIAHCPGNAESRMLSRAAPDSLLAALMRDERPGWLEPVARSAEPGYTIFRVNR